MISGVPWSWRDIFLFSISAGRIFFHPFSSWLLAQSCHFCAPAGLQLHQWDQNQAQGQTGFSRPVKWDLLLFPGSMTSEFGLPSCAGSRPSRARTSCFEASSFPKNCGNLASILSWASKEFRGGVRWKSGGFPPSFLWRTNQDGLGFAKAKSAWAGSQIYFISDPNLSFEFGVSKPKPREDFVKKTSLNSNLLHTFQVVAERNSPPSSSGSNWRGETSAGTHLPSKGANPTRRGAGRETVKGRQDLAWCLCHQNAPIWSCSNTKHLLQASSDLQQGLRHSKCCKNLGQNRRNAAEISLECQSCWSSQENGVVGVWALHKLVEKVCRCLMMVFWRAL